MNGPSYPLPRQTTRAVRVGPLTIGGGAPISVQAMTKTPTVDVEATVAQIHALEAAGCHLVRAAVPDAASARALAAIKARIRIPLVADIHFNYTFALLALDGGVDKLRLNPGNLKNPAHVRAVAAAATARGVPIRIGMNNGSIPAALRARFPFTPAGNAQALVEGALAHIRLLEALDFTDIIVSLKASDVITTVLAYRLMAAARDYPLHVGVTEAGPPPEGLIKSAAGIGQLLGEGLGDTLRVSLTADPVEEVDAGWHLLRALELREGGITLTACPTCARCDVNLDPIAHAVKARLRALDHRLRAAGRSLRVAVMGCEVNGPGEARDADLGIAGAIGEGVLFRQGQSLGRVPEADLVDTLVREVEALAQREGGPVDARLPGGSGS
ncbi:MAG TPA: flavodoxin-dependent (E)-4-hydroxy-3-methylbut-2-enyl-diphosphate synthase [Armatimonadota bacterium]|nr:flavodoxin-dependent (E)-4-hydroxy-3-methylbut-2-enyl-diphosphate synthase [Armatimonadota bacterium]HOS42756.1 flavodoxin-dependent (E)-4-hydroxy-3-methylbut-2-enyl-diphosphate synthase [Armatimonadota bacterium]